jgi:membrane associated rhomboid family serine protease
MIPIGDDIRARRVPVINYLLIVINVLVFLFEFLQGARIEGLLMSLGAVPAYITDPANHPFAFLTLLSSMFLHGGWMHLIGNMLYLGIFGDNVEDVLGHTVYLAFYLAAGVAAGLAQVASAPTAMVPAVGASGAIAGVLAVYLVLYPTAPVRVLVPGFMFMRVARLPAVIVLGMWFVIQLFNGFLSLGMHTMSTGGVAWFAHIGGFVVGLFVGLVLRVAWPQVLARSRDWEEQARTAYPRHRIPRRW